MGEYTSGIGKAGGDSPYQAEIDNATKSKASGSPESTKEDFLTKAVPILSALNTGNPSMKGAPSTSGLNTAMGLSPMKSSFGFDSKFYGHYLPSHFKKTSIINTKGRVR